jgi:peptidoglycan hydrolase CwlO-like protein
MANYLGRNVNLALLVIIIGVVIALVGTTVFFQRGLQNRTNAYETTSLTLSQCQVALTNYQEKYEQAQQKVNETSQDIRKYDDLYEQKTGELKDTQGQLADTQKQLVFEKLQKDKFREFYEAEARTTAQLNATIASQAKQISSLNSQLSSCKADLNDCEAG